MSAHVPHAVFVLGEQDAWRRQLCQQLAQSFGWAQLAVGEVSSDDSFERRVGELAQGGAAMLVVHCNHADAREAAALMNFVAAGGCGLSPCKLVCLLPDAGPDSQSSPCTHLAEELKSKLNVHNEDVIVIRSDPGDPGQLEADCASIGGKMLARPPGYGNNGGLHSHTEAVLDELLRFREEVMRDVRQLQEEFRAFSGATPDASRGDVDDVRRRLSSEVREHVERIACEVRSEQQATLQESYEKLCAEFRDTLQKNLTVPANVDSAAPATSQTEPAETPAKAPETSQTESAGSRPGKPVETSLAEHLEGRLQNLQSQVLENRHRHQSGLRQMQTSVQQLEERLTQRQEEHLAAPAGPTRLEVEAQQRASQLQALRRLSREGLISDAQLLVLGNLDPEAAPPVDLEARVSRIETQLQARRERLQHLASSPPSRSSTPRPSRSPEELRNLQPNNS